MNIINVYCFQIRSVAPNEIVALAGGLVDAEVSIMTNVFPIKL